MFCGTFKELLASLRGLGLSIGSLFSLWPSGTEGRPHYTPQFRAFCHCESLKGPSCVLVKLIAFYHVPRLQESVSMCSVLGHRALLSDQISHQKHLSI